MRRSIWCRAFTAVWGLWFAFSLSESLALRMFTMPMDAMCHGMMEGVMTGDPMAGAATGRETAGRPGGMAQMGGMRMPSSHDPTQPRQDCCSCFGLCCCGGAPVAMPSYAVGLPRVVVRVGNAATQPLRVAARAVRRHYLQPFANGPPALA